MARKHRETHTVLLDSGGKISFSLKFQNFHLTDRDRELVTNLIDMVHDYEELGSVQTSEKRERKERASTEEMESASLGRSGS